MAALICKALYMPCKACGRCMDETCKCCGEACEPCAEVFCNPERPFSSCLFVTCAMTALPAMAVVVIAGLTWADASGACARSSLQTTLLVHIPIFVVHLAFAWYLNRQFVEVERGSAVVSKFWQIFLYDPWVLAFFLFCVFNFVWLGITADALDTARFEGCCNRVPVLCNITNAAFIIEIIYFVIGPFVVAFSLLGECCQGDQRRKEEARARQTRIYERRGNTARTAATAAFAALPVVGWCFRGTSPPTHAQPRRDQGAHEPPRAAHMQRSSNEPMVTSPPMAQAYPASQPPPQYQQPPPAYGSGQPQYHQHYPADPPPQRGQAQGSAASGSARGGQDEESASVLIGKLANKAARGVASGARAGYNAVNNARASNQQANQRQGGSQPGQAQSGQSAYR